MSNNRVYVNLSLTPKLNFFVNFSLILPLSCELVVCYITIIVYGGGIMYYSNGNYEAFARPKKPEGVDEKSAYLVGSGLASLSAACFFNS